MNLKFFSCLLSLFPVLIYAEIDWEELTEKIYLTPEVFQLTPIGEGCTNSNYQLFLDGTNYFVRQAPPESESLGASMEIEFEVLQAIESLHISPKALYFNKNRRLLVTEFIEGAHEADLSNSQTRQKVFAILHQIEALNITISRTYNPSLSDLKTLSHFDLHHGNILTDNDRIWIVDWEYATMTHPYLALASMASTELWDDDQMKTILKEYNPHATLEDYHSLYLCRIVIDIHWASWCQVQASLSTLDRPYNEWQARYLSEALKRIKLNLDVSELNHPSGFSMPSHAQGSSVH